jgi:hypothetical protein
MVNDYLNSIPKWHIDNFIENIGMMMSLGESFQEAVGSAIQISSHSDYCSELMMLGSFWVEQDKIERARRANKKFEDNMKKNIFI